MKKFLILEIIIFAIVLAAAIAVCSKLTQEPSVPAIADTAPATTTAAPSTSQTTVPETTTEPGPTWMTFPATRTLTCQQYFVYDCNGNRFLVLSGDENDARVYPASITKLATALIALEYLQPDTVVTADNVLDMVVWGSSVAGIQLGDSFTVEQLIEAMLLPSGNDAAYVLAAAAGRAISNGDSQQSDSDGAAVSGELPAAAAVEMFMFVMNARAKELGMTNSNFENPDGIHEDTHYMSFADLALLGKLAMENPTIMKYANLPVGDNPNYTPPADGETESTAEDAQRQWKNTNALIHPENKYYCPYAVGLKTGQTPSAGSCLLSAFDYEGRRLIIGVFGCPEQNDRFPDTLQLFNQAIGLQS